MASLPPQQPAPTRRTSSGPVQSSQQAQPNRSNSFSAASVDSQTLLLNSPPEQSEQSEQPTSQRQQQTPTEAATPQPDSEPRRCWICFNDETEDEPTTSEWRSPCPCVLVAHEKCLLDWVADMEAPSARRRAGGRAGKILCPQCKSEIKLERPRSFVVEAVRLGEQLTGMMLLPSFIFVTATAAYSTLRLAGTSAIYQVFGTEDALQILAPIYEAPNVGSTSMATRLFGHLRDHWRLNVGLPMIPTVLIASRTNLVDSFLPFLPLMFFVSSSGLPQDDMLQFSWPPSAAFTVAALPYVRGIYNAYYERVWLPREQRWLKEVQPRSTSDDAANLELQLEHEHEHDHDHDHLHDDDDDTDNEGLELAVDFDMFADWNNGGAADNNEAAENPVVPLARGPGAPIPAPPEEGEESDTDDDMPPLMGNENLHLENPPPDQIGLDRPQQPQPRRQRVRRERNIAFSATNFADTILGALIFPSVAAAVGEALKYALPKSWVMAPATGKSTGLLQNKWGRSIVGGCLFVGVKDAVLLYVRWKMAQSHRRRTVLDYDRSKGKE